MKSRQNSSNFKKVNKRKHGGHDKKHGHGQAVTDATMLSGPMVGFKIFVKSVSRV